MDARASVLRVDVDACFNLCAGLVYPLVHGAPEGTEIRCTCGTSFGVNSFRVQAELLPTPGVCNTTCETDVYGDCDIGSQRCCGANNIFPVYINTELQGCYTPLIPGVKELFLSLPDYDPLLIIDVDVGLTRRPIVSVSGGSTFYLYGCVGLGPLGGVFSAVISLLLPNDPETPMTLDNCAARCDFLGFNAFGMVNGEDCCCAPGVLLDLTLDLMGSCRVACQDDDTVACGGSTVPIVYTTNPLLGIFQNVLGRLELPEYECTPQSTVTLTTTITATVTPTSVEMITTTDTETETNTKVDTTTETTTTTDIETETITTVDTTTETTTATDVIRAVSTEYTATIEIDTTVTNTETITDTIINLVTATRTRTRTTYTTVTAGWPWPWPWAHPHPHPHPTWPPYPYPGDGNAPWTGGGWEQAGGGHDGFGAGHGPHAMGAGGPVPQGNGAEDGEEVPRRDTRPTRNQI